MPAELAEDIDLVGYLIKSWEKKVMLSEVDIEMVDAKLLAKNDAQALVDEWNKRVCISSWESLWGRLMWESMWLGEENHVVTFLTFKI